jgi:uncharacterized protein YbaP (TraB family)
MIRKHLLSSSFSAILLLILAAASASAATNTNKHFLWRLQSPKNTVYFLGSIHAMRPGDYPLPPVIQKAFKQASALVLEINLTKLNPTVTRQMMFAKGLYTKGKTLKDGLPPRTYQRLRKMTQRLGFDFERFKAMKPWLASLVMLSTELKKAGYAAADGIDMHFARLAAQAHKRIIGLETLQYQVGILAGLPKSIQQELLLQSLQEASQFKAEMGRLTKAWKAGDADRMTAIMHKDFHGFPQVYQRLIVKRNRRWLPKLEKLIGRDKDYFVVVGALHLVGKDGLIAQLRKDGYKVKQM